MTVGKDVKNAFEIKLSILADIAESRYLDGYGSSYTQFITPVIFFIQYHAIIDCIRTEILQISQKLAFIKSVENTLK